MSRIPQMNLPLLTARSRVMLFAPHPDDEALATGIFLQRAVRAGAAIRVIYATDGERNGWPQRLLEGRLRLRESDRRRWGTRRRKEALEALRTLGIREVDVRFLSLPDQGVTNVLLSYCGETVRRLASSILEWRPTHLLLPSQSDTHPDHSGLAVLLRLVLRNHSAATSRLTLLHYLVHGSSQSFALRSQIVAPKPCEQKIKRRAILCHATQVALSRRRFLAYAQRPERFTIGHDRAVSLLEGSIRSLERDREQLRLMVSFSLKPFRAEPGAFYLVGHDFGGAPRRFRGALPVRSGEIAVTDCDSRRVIASGLYRGDAFRAEIFLPLSNLATSAPVYLKVDRRGWFFDEAGWVEIPPVVVPRATSIAELAVA